MGYEIFCYLKNELVEVLDDTPKNRKWAAEHYLDRSPIGGKEWRKHNGRRAWWPKDPQTEAAGEEIRKLQQESRRGPEPKEVRDRLRALRKRYKELKASEPERAPARLELSATKRRTYKFRLFDPIEGVESLQNQFRIGHEHRKHLTEIERDRRLAFRAATATPEVTAAVKKLEALEAEVQETEEEVRKIRQKDRRRSEPEESRDRIKALRQQCKELRTVEWKLRIAAQAEHPDIDAEVKRLKEAADEALKASKAAFKVDGLYGDTADAIRDAFDQACEPPKFARKLRPWHERPRYPTRDGSGFVKIRLRAGLTPEAVFAGTSNHVKIDPTPRPVPPRTKKAQHEVELYGAPQHKGKDRPRLSIRVGSDGSKPIWATWPILLHRPFPKEAIIRFVQIICRKEADKPVWSAHFSIEFPDTWRPNRSGKEHRGEPDVCGEGTATVRIGWRDQGGDLVAAEAIDGRGRLIKPLLLPAWLRLKAKHVEQNQSLRDEYRDAIKEALKAWLAEHKKKAPKWLRDATRTLSQWYAQRRFAGLETTWRERRFPGDEEIYPALAVWRKRDKHLWTWEVHERAKVQNQRNALYQKWAVDLARRYTTVVLSNIDYRKLQQQGDETESGKSDLVTEQQRSVSPSLLRDTIADAFRVRGGEVILDQKLVQAAFYAARKQAKA